MSHRNFRSSIEYDLHMNSHKYSDLLGVKRNLVEHKTKCYLRLVHTRLVRKSIRISATSHKRGDLLDKLSDWIQYATWLEKKRKRNLALAQKIELQRLATQYDNMTQQNRESKDIRTKSKSSNSLNSSSKLQSIKNPRALHDDRTYLNSNNDSLSGNSFSNESASTHGVGKVKLKIKVDPNRYKEKPNTSTYFHTSTPRNFNSKRDRLVSQSSPLLQSALKASTQKKIYSPSDSLKPSHSLIIEKQFNCLECPKQFSLRSSFLRHVRAQHGIDTRSHQFVQYLKNQSSVSQQNALYNNVTFPTQPLPPSNLSYNEANFSTKLYDVAVNRKRKVQDGGLIPAESKPGKKIKLSLKLGRNRLKESSNDVMKLQLNSINYDERQQSSFQELSPATSPASKVCV